MDLNLLYSDCRLCPRMCRVDRTAGELGYCKSSPEMKAATACLHKGEEPVIAGSNGSGTIFFSGCTLKCCFCQNHQISHHSMGKIIDNTEFADICLKIQELGAHNINIVTGTHFIPSIITGLEKAKSRGLYLPIVWNTSSYETVESIRILNDFTDIYLADVRVMDNENGKKLLNASNYTETALKAIRCMLKTKSIIIENDIMKQGVIIRHLVLPGLLDSTEKFLKWYSSEVKGSALLSLMVQYIPPKGLHLNEPQKIEAPSDYLSSAEYERIMEMLYQYDIDEGFVQECEGNNSWAPDFQKANPFPEGLAKPIWSWKTGFINQGL